ncbi:MAG TPA: PTS sugar transporter subunit IIC, partial [Candidatus Dorea intestinavium]|nr:PTS sugar transporter subunit IIC [Candidatus Dorea intestinavium]
TSMLQVPNIVRKPIIWLPAILSSAILGPIGTMVFHMTSNATGSGMGTAGLVGPIMAYQTMIESMPKNTVLLTIAILLFVLPALVTLAISEAMRKLKWIKPGDMALDL